jgi:putative glycosyltransferase
MRLSVVATLYRSAPQLREFHARARAAAESISPDFEIVLVNDGSPDDSLSVAVELQRADPHLRVVDLSRNFGHHRAMMAGLAHARGDLVFLVDSDLEVDPEVLLPFHRQMALTGADVVFGVQESRRGSFVSRLLAGVYYSVFNWLSDTDLPRNLVTARLMTRRYLSALVEHREREIMIAGLWALAGFQQVPCPVRKGHKGSSTYTLGGKIAIVVNAVTSFSNKPLVMVFYLGMLLSLGAALAALYLVAGRLLFGIFLTGWLSLIVAVWFFGGLTIFCLGVLGIYLSKIFTETKQRPYVIVRHVYEAPDESHDAG